MTTDALERLAERNDNMPQYLCESDACLFLFLRCIYREVKAGILPIKEADREKRAFYKHYNNTEELKKIYFSQIKRWQNCECFFSEVEKSKCNECSTCETCRKIARILDGRRI